MKRILVGALILMFLFGGAVMAVTPVDGPQKGPQVGEGDVQATITIQGSADFRVFGDFANIELPVQPFEDSKSNVVQWRVLANAPVVVEFASVGPQTIDTAVPAWAHSFFQYTVTEDSRDFEFALKSVDSDVDQEGNPKSELVAETAADNGTAATNGTRLTGTIFLEYFAPDWTDLGNFPNDSEGSNSFLDLGEPDDKYYDVVQVTIYASVGQ